MQNIFSFNNWSELSHLPFSYLSHSHFLEYFHYEMIDQKDIFQIVFLGTLYNRSKVSQDPIYNLIGWRVANRLDNAGLERFCLTENWINCQSRINIGSDGTLARACVWIGLKRAPQFIFWGPYLSTYYKTDHKVQKDMGITLKKNIRGSKKFSPGPQIP